MANEAEALAREKMRRMLLAGEKIELDKNGKPVPASDPNVREGITIIEHNDDPDLELVLTIDGEFQAISKSQADNISIVKKGFLAIENILELEIEYLGLKAILSENGIDFLGFNKAIPYFIIAQQTNSGNIYTAKIDYSNNYPGRQPAVFIVNPKPLLTKSGESMLSESHQMETGLGEDGCVRINIFGRIDMRPRASLYNAIIRTRLWLEAYECHLKTGANMSNYLGC